jgi:1,4-dihydroxy-2-naphthoyl-CoA synthase
VSELQFETARRVALIRLNRPQTLNALTLPMLAQIREMVRRAEADPEVTAIAFTGEGRGFCSGLDSSALVEATAAGSGGQRRAQGADLPGMFRSLMEVLGQAGYLTRGSPASVVAGRLEMYARSMIILTFGGGTNEIQRDLIAIFGLGMPRSLR